MKAIIGIGKEEKNIWERRVPLIPAHVGELIRDHQLDIRVQTSSIRIFPDGDFRMEGAKIIDDLSPCSLIFAIKEIPIPHVEKGKVYIFFTHTTKGQSHNMPLLKKMVDLGCSMVDYEKIVNEKGQRLLFFGRQAGEAGMIETLWSFGQRLNVEGLTDNPFSTLKQTYKYRSLAEAKEDVRSVGRQIREKGLDPKLVPLVCGFTGYGHVSQGAQEIFELLPFEEIPPASLAAFFKAKKYSGSKLYKVVFKESDMVEPKAKGAPFELQDFYDHPEKYRPVFDSSVPYLTLLVNCIFWAPKYPKYVTKDYLKKLYGGPTAPRLRVVGDITCDINGSMECTIKATEPDVPSFVYDPFQDVALDGFVGNGPVVMVVDNLPAEIPLESSVFFSGALKTFVPQIASADFSGSLANCHLPDPVRRALILFRGQFTPEYEYMRKFIA
jgi:saccharopine dehydrogenase (NAD+, L-lysine-forming)